MSDELERKNPFGQDDCDPGCDVCPDEGARIAGDDASEELQAEAVDGACDPGCDMTAGRDDCASTSVSGEVVQAEAGAPASGDSEDSEGACPGAPSDDEGDFPEDDHARRSRVQNRRAAIAVAIMVLISAVLIGGVKLMYFVAERANEPAQVGTVVPGAIQRALEVKAEVEGTEPTEPFYMLLIGSDSRKGTALYTGKSDSHAQVDQHSDVMTLLRVDPVNYVLTFVTIPRDTQLEGDDGKICDSLKKGKPEQVVKAAETLTGVQIDYYMMVGFVGFEDMVDDMLGVEVDVPAKATLIDPKTTKKVSITPGEAKLLDGSQSLVLARARSIYDEHQDAYRQINVRNLEMSLIERAIVTYQGPQGITLLLETFSDNVTTDMDDGLIAVLARDFIENGRLITFYSCTGPYEGDVNDDGLWVVPEDKEAWSKLMAAVDAGADPTTVAEPLSFEDEDAGDGGDDAGEDAD